jgi:hypothetical protein
LLCGIFGFGLYRLELQSVSEYLFLSTGATSDIPQTLRIPSPNKPPKARPRVFTIPKPSPRSIYLSSDGEPAHQRALGLIGAAVPPPATSFGVLGAESFFLNPSIISWALTFNSSGTTQYAEPSDRRMKKAPFSHSWKVDNVAA